MSTTADLVAALKKELKTAQMTYADLAQQLGMAESSVKRMLAGGEMSLSRVDAICRALKLFGKHARATGKLAVYIERHMNAVRILVDSVELILVALLVHKNDAAHQRRVIKASRLKLDIHGCPFIQCER